MSILLQDISDPTLIQGGIVPSLHKLQCPLWIDGMNVVFEDNSVRKAPGYVKVFANAGNNPVSAILAVDVGGNPELLWGDITKLYRYNGTTVTTEATGFSGIINRDAVQDNAFENDAFQVDTTMVPAIWDMETWGTWAIATNGVDPIQIDKMSGAGATALTGTPPEFARCIVRFANQMLAFNTDLDAEGFEWCEIDNVEQWIPSDTSSAGNLPIRDMGSEIIAAERLGDYVAVYAEDCMALVSSLGAPYYFGAKKVLEGIGSCGVNAVIPVGYYNYGFSKKGIWKTDGASYQYISPPYMRKWIEDNVNPGFINQISGLLNEDRSLLEWGVPSKTGGGANDITVCYNIDNNSWTFKGYGMTAGTMKGIFSFPIFALSNGSVMFGELGVDADTSAMASFVQSKPFTCITPKPDKSSGNYYKPSINLEWKIVESLFVHLQRLSGTGVRIYIGTQNHLDDAITWSAAITPDASSQPIFPVSELEGKYITLKIASTAIGDNWQFCGAEIFGSYNGQEI